MDVRRCSMFLFFAAFTVSLVLTDPVPLETDGNVPKTVKLNMFSSFDEMAGFLRRWFSTLRNRLLNDRGNDVDTQTSNEGNRHKRQVHIPQGFEAYEIYFLQTTIIKDLKTMFAFAKELQGNNTEARTKIDDLFQREEARVMRMSETELRQYTQALRSALQTGITSTQKLSVNGVVYDMKNVASWCCPF